mgnify:FL=1
MKQTVATKQSTKGKTGTFAKEPQQSKKNIKELRKIYFLGKIFFLAFTVSFLVIICHIFGILCLPELYLNIIPLVGFSICSLIGFYYFIKLTSRSALKLNNKNEKLTKENSKLIKLLQQMETQLKLKDEKISQQYNIICQLKDSLSRSRTLVKTLKSSKK